jgi:hypothetical protein
MEVLDKIKQVVELLDELDDYLDLLPGLQSESDQRISDIYHYIETNSLNYKNSYRLTKELKEVLLKRRDYKNDFAILKKFNDEKGRLNLKANRQILISDLYKAQKNLVYHYRVYDEQEFKDRMEG